MKQFFTFPRHRLILLAILIAALVMRLIGINWDLGSRMHPDERFMTTVVGEIGKSENLNEDTLAQCPDVVQQTAYFNTQCSVLNPNNVIDGSYVYGTLPLFIVRLAAQLVSIINPGGLENPAQWQTYDYIFLIGRGVNALADTLSILVIYLIGRRLFTRNHGLLAAGFYAFAALPIQLSHYWTVDIQSNLFALSTLYAAIEIGLRGRFWGYLLFGVALAAALASRINLYPLAGLLPLALILRYWLGWYEHRESGAEERYRLVMRRRWIEDGLLALFAIVLALLAFRVFQPYSFVGPTINNWSLDQEWIDELVSVSDLSRTPSDSWPPSIQWFDRIPYVYPWVQMAFWGMGFGLGIAGTLALVAAIVVQIRRRKPDFALALLSIWILAYFATTGGIHLMTMRYYLPMYGALALLASWGLLALPQRARRPLLVLAAGATAIWGVAFLNIYTQTFTRVEASRWFETNIPGTVTFLDDNSAMVMARIDERAFTVAMMPAYRGESYLGEGFELTADQRLTGFELRFTDGPLVTTRVQLIRGGDDEEQSVVYEYLPTSDPNDINLFVLTVPDDPVLPPGIYRWHVANDWVGGASMRGYIGTNLLLDGTNAVREAVSFRHPYENTPYIPLDNQRNLEAVLEADIATTELMLPHVFGLAPRLEIQVDGDIYTAVESDSLPAPMGNQVSYDLDRPMNLERGTRIKITSPTPVYITGTLLATEGRWDDGVPLLYCDYRPTSDFFANLVGGLHRDCDGMQTYSRGWYVQLQMNMADGDSELRMRRMSDILQKADYLVISSNRFYDSLPRVPVRFATSAAYYDALFAGELGYQRILSAVRFPSLLGVALPDQALPGAPRWMNEWEAEEAFTVYDHPSVFVYRNEGFNEAAFPAYAPFVTGQRGFVDLDALSEATYALSPRPQTDNDVVRSLIVWVLFFGLLGWVSYPLVYTLFPTVLLRGFAVGRALSWLFAAFAAWYLTAVGLTGFWTQSGIIVLLMIWLAINGVVFYLRRQEIVAYVREHARVFLLTEALFLLLLVIGLLLRAVSPELWAVSRGGEKPMDFAYLNAVLRTPQFPPPNPWLAEFEINYYYFGFVIAALPIKLLNTASEIGYNLVMGLLYPSIFMVVFVVCHLLLPSMRAAWRAALALVGGALAMLAGNLGTLQLILSPEPNMDAHRWYWYPTRVLGESANRAGGAINEVPLFSFLFGDMHAHVMGLLPTTLALFVMVVMLQTKRWWTYALLGVISATILMTNTWDVFLYVPLGAAAVWWSTLNLGLFVRRGIIVALSGGLAIAPFLLNFSSGAANGLDWWNGERSLIEPWLIVWGIPLVVALFWLMQRARAVWFADAKVPLELGIIGVFVVAILVPVPEVATSVLCLMVLSLATLLALRDEHQHRFVHAAIAVCVGVLLLIEYVVVRNDVGRMNTVFKFSFQLWVWFALIVPIIIYRLFEKGNRVAGVLALGLVALGLLYPLGAIPARYTANASGGLTLDGNRFLQTLVIAAREDMPRTFTADEDSALIYFMRQELRGFPIIAEWYTAEYQWNSRISVQTGLSSVVGWANHMRQQYSRMVPLVTERIADMQQLYRSENPTEIANLIEKYQIDYIVVGQLELGYGSPITFALLDQMAQAGTLEVAYRVGETVLYRVVRSDEIESVMP